MQIIIKGTNIRVTEGIKDWIHKKFEGLKKLHPDLKKKDKMSAQRKGERTDVFVEVGTITEGQRKGKIFRAEAQFRLAGRTFRAVSVKENLNQAIIKAAAELKRQVKRFKGKQKAKFEKGARRLKRGKL